MASLMTCKIHLLPEPAHSVARPGASSSMFPIILSCLGILSNIVPCISCDSRPAMAYCETGHFQSFPNSFPKMTIDKSTTAKKSKK